VPQKTNIDQNNDVTEKQLPNEVEFDSPGMANVNTVKQRTTRATDFNAINSSKKESSTKTEVINLPHNNLAEPTHNPNVINVRPNDIANAKLDFPSRETLTDNAELRKQIAVTPASVQPLYTSNTSTQEKEDVNQKGKKGGFRGFVRKITRTFEKTTDFEATDGDDRLLIAGLAIKL
jgi:hypothetical protein